MRVEQENQDRDNVRDFGDADGRRNRIRLDLPRAGCGGERAALLCDAGGVAGGFRNTVQASAQTAEDVIISGGVDDVAKNRHYGKRSLHFMTKDCSVYSAGARLPYIGPQATK